MRAHRIKAHVSPNQPLVVPLPADVPEAEVEVIVLIPDARPAGRFDSLRAFNEWLRRQPFTGRSKKEIDDALAEERSSWE
jgi:hypothetical protein